MYLPSWTGFIVLLISVICIVHVIKRSRQYWWILIILFFPVLGALIYFFLEVIPDLRRGELGKDLSAVGEKLKSPQARIRQIEKELESTPTIEKRVELAEAHGTAEQWEKAAEIYRQCTSGPFDDDPFILYGSAYAHFQVEDYEYAEECLKKIEETKSKDKREHRRLLRLRIWEKTDRAAEALKAYPDLLEAFSGEEARYRYACLLKKLGQAEEGDQILEKMVSEANQHSPLYRKQNRIWIQRAKNASNQA